MIEKVNPMHPDKIADRIAGAIVDLTYKANDNPKVAVEVLIGHGVCHVIIETTEKESKNLRSDNLAKDGTYRGGRRVRAGDKPKPVAEKIQAALW